MVLDLYFVFVQLLSHPFITKYEDSQVDLAAFVQSLFDPVQRLKDLADVSFSLFCTLIQVCNLV